jgi:hypothetical protein
MKLLLWLHLFVVVLVCLLGGGPAPQTAREAAWLQQHQVAHSEAEQVAAEYAAHRR